MMPFILMPPPTSQVHRRFVSEPMGYKLVTQLPGIGEALGSKLSAAGFTRARQVLGKYLMLNEDQVRFEQWLIREFLADAQQAGNCYEGLRVWCNSHL